MISNNICGGHTPGIATGITIFLLLLVGGAGAATLTVDISGGANYTKIQDAINETNEGDTILVNNGTYYEHLLINKNNLSVIGVNKDTVIIDGKGTGAVVRIYNANNTQMSGFTIQNSSTFSPTDYSFDTWVLQEGYTLKIISIDARASPRQLWMQLYKGDSVKDDHVLSGGQEYSYSDGDNLIINATVDAIFSGNSVTVVKLGRVHQYSETNESILINNASHTFTSGVIHKIEWSLNDGYSLALNDIDPRAVPRLSWLELSKNGIAVDDKIISAGQTYSYYNASGKINATVDAIFSGNSVTVVKLGRVHQYSETNESILINNASHTFTSGVTHKIEWSLNDGYSLALNDIDPRAVPRLSWLELSKNGIAVDDKIISAGQTYSYYNASGKINATVDAIFDGISTDMVKLTKINQFSDLNESILINNADYMFTSGTANKLDWPLSNGYILSLIDMDIKASPRQVWMRFSNSNEVLDERVVALGEMYSFYNNSNLIINATVDDIFSGTFVNSAKLLRINQFSESNHDILISNESNIFTYGIINKISWRLNEGYILSVVDIDSKTSPRRVWLDLSKDDGDALDHKVLAAGERYLYYNSTGALIINGTVSDIFDGSKSSFIMFKDFYQYSEIDGQVLINGIIKEIVFNSPDTGIFSYNSSNNTMLNNTISNNPIGIYLSYSSNHTISGNNVLSNYYYGIIIGDSSNNAVYNNYFNNTNNFEIIYSVSKWNTTKAPGMNIIGGPYLGGNFWVNPNGTGFSQTCIGGDSDGICDSSYALDSSNVDYLPLALVGSYPAPTPTTTSPPSGSSSGGGGGGASGEDYSNIEIKEKYDLHIYKDKVTAYKFTSKNNPILFINITGNTSAGEVTAAVEMLRNTSSLVKSSPHGIVYKNINIWVGTSGFAVPRNIKEAVIGFRVENSWLNNSKIAGSDIKMVRWDGNGWITLETTEKSRDSTNTYYEAKTDSFSSFAIAGFRDSITAAAPSEANMTQAEAIAPAQTEDQTKKAAGFGILLAITTLLAVYILRQRRR